MDSAVPALNICQVNLVDGTERDRVFIDRPEDKEILLLEVEWSASVKRVLPVQERELMLLKLAKMITSCIAKNVTANDDSDGGQ